MSRLAIAPRSVVERKPAHGQPCTHCGLCCLMTVCSLGRVVLGQAEGPCPALDFDADKKSSCGLIANPMAFAPLHTIAHGVENMTAAAKVILGSGDGCDARINSEPIDFAFKAKCNQDDAANWQQLANAKEMWGVK